ncbi:hypothetical protein EV363DRAFT_1177980 [Boletus edulis]|nr:hypothetical protein EV363DRAFT_1177980 [Boletus edulis]
MIAHSKQVISHPSTLNFKPAKQPIPPACPGFFGTRSVQNQCKMRPDLIRSWPSPYQEMYINSTKHQLSVGQDQTKENNINNQIKQGFKVNRREKLTPPPSTSKQIPNN